MELLWEGIKYSKYQWSLYRDLKFIGLMGMQAGFTKNCCFLCLWDSRAVSQHYKKKDWGSRSTFAPGEHSLKENHLVDMNRVFLPPLHIKLGLMKNFVKALPKNGATFEHLSTVFPGLSTAKLKDGIFVEPQIREVLKDNDFEELLNLKELRAGEAFKSVYSGFLGNTRVPDYQAWEVAKVLLGYGVPNVTQDSFSPFPPQLLPAKPWSSEWWAWRKIPPRHYENGEQLSRQMEPRHSGRLLLDALAWHPGGKIHQIF